MTTLADGILILYIIFRRNKAQKTDGLSEKYIENKACISCESSADQALFSQKINSKKLKFSFYLSRHNYHHVNTPI